MYKQDTLLHSLVARAASCTNKIQYCTALWQELPPVQTRYTIAQRCGKSCLLYKQDTLLHSIVAGAASCTNKIPYCTALWQELQPVQTRYHIAQPCGKSCLLYKQDTLLHSLVARAASCTNKIHYCTALWQELQPVQTRYPIAQPCGKSCLLYKQDTLLHSLVARAASCTNKMHYCTPSLLQVLCPVQTRYTIAQPCDKSCSLYKQDTLLDSLVARVASCTNKMHYCTPSLLQVLCPVQTRYPIAQPCGPIVYLVCTVCSSCHKAVQWCILFVQDTALATSQVCNSVSCLYRRQLLPQGCAIGYLVCTGCSSCHKAVQ